MWSVARHLGRKRAGFQLTAIKQKKKPKILIRTIGFDIILGKNLDAIRWLGIKHGCHVSRHGKSIRGNCGGIIGQIK